MKPTKAVLPLLSGLVSASLLLSACQAPATSTPQATEEVKPTETTAAVEPTTEPTAAPTEAATEAATAEPTGDLMKVEAPDCTYGGEFKSIEAVDASTVRFTLCGPDVAFPAKVAFSAFAINDADYLKETGGTGDLIEKPNGTGPYMLKDWKRGEEMDFVRNDNYWGEKAIAENLIFRWSTESAQRLVELNAGTVDGIDNIGPDDFETVQNDSNLQLQLRGGTNIFYLGMNNTYPPFDNEKVRQAFAMAIDKERIVENFYPPGSSVADQFMPPSIFGYTPEVEWYEYNPEKAKEILTEEGVLPGFKTTITYRDVVRGYLPNPGVVAQDIQAQLKDIGVETEIVVMDSGAYIDATTAGEIKGFHLLGWGADYPDATNFLDFHFGEGASKQFGTGFEDIWEALKNGATRANPEDRYPFYVEANNLIKEHVPMIPIAHGGNGGAFKADVKGAYVSDFGAEQFARMDPGGRDTFVWLQNAEPSGLYCADETDGEALRACEQVMESLLAFEPGTGKPVAALAESWEANDDLTVWTFKLRPGVKFQNGADLDANDVVLSYVVQWDAENELHVGRDGSFSYWTGLFGPFLNAPKE